MPRTGQPSRSRPTVDAQKAPIRSRAPPRPDPCAAGAGSADRAGAPALLMRPLGARNRLAPRSTPQPRTRAAPGFDCRSARRPGSLEAVRTPDRPGADRPYRAGTVPKVGSEKPCRFDRASATSGTLPATTRASWAGLAYVSAPLLLGGRNVLAWLEAGSCTRSLLRDRARTRQRRRA